MKTYLFLFSFLIAASLSITAQETISFTDFDELVIKGNLEVILTPGTETGVIIERGEDKSVRIEQQGKKLTVRHADLYRYKSYREFPVKVEIIYNELDMISAMAGTKLSAIESLTGIRVDLKLRSGAQAKLDLQAEKSDVNVGEGAVATLTGRVSQFTGIASTGGQLEAQDLISERCKIRANTGGMASIQAKEYLDAAAHTGGTICYRGAPSEVVCNDNLGGSIIKRG